MYIVPTIPHLRNLKLTMAYRELPENEAQLTKWAPTQKWKNDPDAHRFYGFAPRNKYYLNGTLVHEERPRLADVSKTPFPEKRVPRRGLTAVPPEDPRLRSALQGAGTQQPPYGKRLAASPSEKLYFIYIEQYNGHPRHKQRDVALSGSPYRHKRRHSPRGRHCAATSPRDRVEVIS